MGTITELFTLVNAHDAETIKNSLSNKKTVENIKWTHRKNSLNILSRCVDVHAHDCFDVIIDGYDFNKLEDNGWDMYGSALVISTENYLVNPTDKNYHFITGILKKKPNYATNFIMNIIKANKPEIFSKNIHLIDKFNQDEIYSYLSESIYYSSLKIFEILYAEAIKFEQDINSRILPSITDSKNSIIFLNWISAHGFTWEHLLTEDIFEFSDNCFDYLYAHLKDVKPSEYIDNKFNNITKYDFSNVLKNESYKRMYKLLELPIPITELDKFYNGIFPQQLLQVVANAKPFKYPETNTFRYLYMCFELKPELMGKINFFSETFEKFLEKSLENEKHSIAFGGWYTNDWYYRYGSGYVFIQELLWLLNSQGIQIKQEYVHMINDFKPEENDKYNKWKQLEIKPDKPAKQTKSKSKKPKEINL